MKAKHLETELYEPVANFFIEKGFKVRSEVLGCDVTAIKDDTLVITELKLSFNMKLLMQAVDRLSITDYVYVAIPRPLLTDKNGVNSSFWNDMLSILKRLEIGLLLVALDSPMKSVEPVLHPMSGVIRKKTVNRLKIIQEIDRRVGDFNTGGSGRSKINTAYREKSVHMACIIYEKGKISTKELRFMGLTQRELTLLQANHYGWFYRVETGVYGLTEQGIGFIENPEPQFEKLVNYYRYGQL